MLSYPHKDFSNILTHCVYSGILIRKSIAWHFINLFLIYKSFKIYIQGSPLPITWVHFTDDHQT